MIVVLLGESQKRLFDVGANVIFTYRQERSLKKLQKQLENYGQPEALLYNVTSTVTTAQKQPSMRLALKSALSTALYTL